MIVLSIEEFSAKRRTAQTRIEDVLRPIVERALDGNVNTDGYRELMQSVRDQWMVAYADEAGVTGPPVPASFRMAVISTLRKTDRAKTDKYSVERITVWLATAILSSATMKAAQDDPEELFLEWVDMGDDHVREAHKEASGQVRPIGEKFKVDGFEMDGPGDPRVPIELWINCRCTLRPTLAASFALDGLTRPLDEPTHAGLAVYAADSGRILMIQRSMDQDDEPDVQGTWEFPGGTIEEGESPQEAAEREFCEETGLPVPEGEITNGWRSDDGIYQGFVLTVPVEQDAFEEINPDLAAAETVNPDDPERRNPDVSAWFTIEQVQNLGPALRPEVAKTDWSLFGQQKEDVMPDTAPEDVPQEEPAAAGLVPWHGVLAPEGIRSGDGRKFAAGSLRVRPLPLPLTWQKQSADGHGGNVTVARIDRIERVGAEMRGSGVMLAIPESDEVVGLIAEFGRFGVSIDADDASFEMEEDTDEVVFTDARIASACIVPIPAFAEAWVALGEAPEEFFPAESEPLEVEGESAPEEALVAAAAPANVFVDVAPGKTEDGPGWLTNPVDTDRLRDYWVHGEGAAKIGWGTPGDFNRCRINVAEYVKPQHLNGYCANRHYDALGFWPGPKAHAADSLEFTQAAEALTLVASAGIKAPHEWFTMEEPDHVQPLRITEEGQVFGHIAEWNTCHANWADQCVIAPKSPSNYAHFLLGEVLTTEGSVPVGALTIGGGHAAGRLRMRPAMAHYDDVSTAFADVSVKDGKYGIWCCGWIRPGTSEEMIVAARASKLSGDWRDKNGQMEMIAAHCVNAPGFGIQRVAAAVEGDRQISLVAAGMVSDEPQQMAVDTAAIAKAVFDLIENSRRNREKMSALAARVKGTN